MVQASLSCRASMTARVPELVAHPPDENRDTEATAGLKLCEVSLRPQAGLRPEQPSDDLPGNLHAPCVPGRASALRAAGSNRRPRAAPGRTRGEDSHCSPEDSNPTGWPPRTSPLRPGRHEPYGPRSALYVPYTTRRHAQQRATMRSHHPHHAGTILTSSNVNATSSAFQARDAGPIPVTRSRRPWVEPGPPNEHDRGLS